MSHQPFELNGTAAPSASAHAVYLIACSLNGHVPATDEAADGVLQLCHGHQVTALCALALKDAGQRDPAWEHELAFTEYKHALQAAERDVVLDALERHHIRHMPLKGTILSELYPSPLMREMCDSDILIDKAKVREVDEVMEGLGFKFESDSSSHRSFLKPPFLNFEMHYRLFVEEMHPQLAHCFDDAWSMAAPDEGTAYRYRFAPTDFYIYMTLHAYKHYAGAGFGLRTLADEYVMLTQLDGIDFKRVDEAMARLGTRRFETALRGLGGKLFDKALLADGGRPLFDAMTGKNDVLMPAELRMLEHVVASGSYGTVAQAAQRKINKSLGADMDERPQTSPLDDVRYILQRTFPPVRELRCGYPVLRHPAGMALLPGIYAFRLARGLTTRREKTSIELKELKKATG